MQPRLTLVTLGVTDLDRARTFYTRLGFPILEGSGDNVVFLDAGGVLLGLFGRAALAHDAHVENSQPGFSGVTLARVVASEAEVDALLAEAVAAGATLKQPGQKVFWGGYSGYFADLDGHLWEVAFNPFWPMDAAGRVVLATATEKTP